MNFSEFFKMGGPLFMSILTLLLVGMVAWIIYYLIRGLSGNISSQTALRQLVYGRSIGLFALITGILGQLIGLFQAFTYIHKMGNVSPSIMYEGIKVSMITTLYGFFIYLLALILWFVATIIIEKKYHSS